MNFRKGRTADFDASSLQGNSRQLLVMSRECTIVFHSSYRARSRIKG